MAKIEPDFLKIDGSLIKNIHNSKDFDVVKAIIDFAKLYNIKTVAEFVEDEEIYILVKELGSDYSQGYYFGKPNAIQNI
ncbi:MAG: EAL domain-containing protein [Campylobacterales bacterium]|nr:EAL domain-containing protein [Campylobacterales bacterium]